jgi:hypothetical protein
MPCACGGGQQPKPAEEFVVKLNNGEELTVASEHEARVHITRAGGGTYSRK